MAKDEKDDGDSLATILHSVDTNDTFATMTGYMRMDAAASGERIMVLKLQCG